jgi:hypothetical protein
MRSGMRAVFRSFSESAKPILTLMDDIDAEASAAMRSGVVRAKHEAVRSASIVLLSGFLESYLRQSAEAFFFALVEKNLAFSQLPESMHKVHFVAGLDEVQKVAKDDKRDSPATFASTLAAIARITHAPTAKVSALYWEAFAVTKGNPGPDVIAEYLRNFSVKDPLKAVALEAKKPESFVRTYLSSFVHLRNECAHTGKIKNTPQPSEIRDYVHFLRLLTLSLAKVLDKQITTLCVGAQALVA